MKFKTWQLLSGFGLVTVCTVLVTLLALNSRAQIRTADLQPCQPPRTHYEAWQRFRSLPVKFTDIKEDTVYWKFEDPTGVYLGSFQIEKTSAFFNEKFEKKDRLYFEFNLTSQWGVNYDSECKNIISAVEIK